MPPDPSEGSNEWVALNGLPGMKRLQVAYISVIDAEDNPENTMQLALTARELSTILMGNMLISTLFGELGNVTGRLNLKLFELSKAQDFTSPPAGGA